MSGLVSVYGATGYTGRLVLRAARARGLRTRAVARSPAKLADASRAWESALGLPPAPPLETATADSTDPASVRAALEGSQVVLATAGPFSEFGTVARDAAIAVGAHYLDSTGEQPFVRDTQEKAAGPARDRGVAVVNAFAFEVAPADLAAALAAAGMDGIEELVVAYSVKGAATSRGTRLSMLRMGTSPGWRWEQGGIVEHRMGQELRRIRYPEPAGERSAFSVPGAEALIIPLHVGARNCRVFMGGAWWQAQGARVVGAALPWLFRTPLRETIRRMASSVGGEGPPEERRSAARFMVLVEALRSDRWRRVVVRGNDPYGITGELLAEGARWLVDGRDTGARGVLAPAQLFDPAGFFDAVKPCDLSYETSEGALP
jgi:short subunit dehydrogenase-like uncharacterized protein